MNHPRLQSRASQLRIYNGPADEPSEVDLLDSEKSPETIAMTLAEVLPLLVERRAVGADMAAQLRRGSHHHLDRSLRSHPRLPALPPAVGIASRQAERVDAGPAGFATAANLGGPPKKRSLRPELSGRFRFRNARKSPWFK